MSDTVTIARPYAKAMFNHALADKKLAEWSAILSTLALIVLDEQACQLISNPSSATSMQADLIWSVFERIMPDSLSAQVDGTQINNVIRLLAANKRLLLLPDILVEFELLRAEQEKTLAVDVTSFSALTEEQQQQLRQSLSLRLQRQVVLHLNVDPSLLGGAVIRAGDLVIDGSVLGKLTKLGTDLAA
jgi:F-type H+-transporting ATPase subunit delta